MARWGVSRREFIELCAGAAALLGLPKSAARAMAAAAYAAKPSIVWVEYQDCAGCTESFLRAEHPTAAELVLDALSIDYHETIMAAAGAQAEAARQLATANRGQYIAVVEGSIPSGEHGAYCTIGGRSAVELAREVVGGAAATIAVGSCASFGGLAAASPNPTGAMGVGEAVPGAKNLVNLPGCPVNVENLVALVVHFLTYQKWPPLDAWRRPLFAHGKLIHDACERRAHFDAGQFAEAWGDEGHRKGYCLYKLGCKGPSTSHNCPAVRWNGGTSWPVAAGHPCIGCAEPKFWDQMTPFYTHLAGFGGGTDVDRIGVWAAAGVGAALTAHMAVRVGTHLRGRRYEDAKEAAKEAAQEAAEAKEEKKP